MAQFASHPVRNPDSPDAMPPDTRWRETACASPTDDPLWDVTISGEGEEFSDLVALAGCLFDTPIAALLVHEAGNIRALAQQGLAGAEVTGNALLMAVGPTNPRLQLSDASTQPAFRNDPIVAGEPRVRFFLSTSITGSGGMCLGTLVVADIIARDHLPPNSDRALIRIGRLAAKLMERHQLQRRNRIARQIMQADFSAVIVLDEYGVSFVNRAAESLFGGRARAMRGMPTDVLFPSNLQPDPAAAAAWLRGEVTDTAQRFHLYAQCLEGERRTLEAARCAWKVPSGEGVALILRDVTEQLAKQENLHRIAMYDTLTGLPNRNALVETIGSHVTAGTGSLGLALLGLDNFKAINDTLGHSTGDAVLHTAATRLQSALPDGATIARFGGDEFALIYPGVDDEALELHLDEVLRSISRPYDVDGHVIHLDASIGLAIHERDNDVCTGNELIARADLALYKAKASGGRRRCRFDPGMRREVIDRRTLDLELRRAHAEGEFELHYQPQINLTSGMTFGAEALLRWRHPTRGLLSPVFFIDALASSPVAADVGHWIIHQACHDAARWRQIDGCDMAISVNLFPVQVTDGRLHDKIDAALASSGLPANRLELEITETIALQPDDSAARSLADLRARGVRLAFDDFGTGYASLSMLQRFPIDRVKIDRSFVRDMLANNGDAAIVRSILLISRNLELEVIAEGVENHDQARLLQGLGCQGAQGFLYAPALAQREFDHWLATQLGSAVPMQVDPTLVDPERINPGAAA